MPKATDQASESFAKWLKYKRQKNKWSIQKLADTSEISKSALWNIEQSNTSPTLSTVNAICQAFGLKAVDALVEALEL